MIRIWTKTLLCLLCTIFLMEQAAAFAVGGPCTEIVDQSHVGHTMTSMVNKDGTSHRAMDHEEAQSIPDCCEMEQGGNCPMAQCITAIPAPNLFFSAIAAFPVSHTLFVESYTNAPPVAIDRPPILHS